MSTKPYLFQLKDVRQIARMGGRALCSHDMGLGKTLISLLYLHRHPECLPAVIVCPAPLKWQWQREAARHYGLRAEVLSGVNPTPFGIAGTPPAVIVNYEILGPSRHGPGWVDALKALKPQMVIIDESAAVKDPRSGRCKAVKKLCQGVPNVLFLSATPIEIRPMELWSTLNILRPEKFPSQWRFGHTYCGAKKTPWAWDFSGASRLDELSKELEGIMIRRRKADVIKDLPKKIRSVVPLELSDPRQYELASSDFLKWLMKTSPGRIAGASRASGLAKAGHLKRLAAELKLPAAIGWVDLWLESNPGKILLFCAHRKIVSTLHARYRKTCVVVDGSVTGKKRQAAVDQFQNNAGSRVFIGNMQAAGKGLNLTAAYASAFMELPWKPTDVTQAEDRAYARLSDMHGTQSFFLTAVGTIEERIANMLQKRQRLVSKVLDGEGDSEQLDLFDLLCDSLRKETACK